MPRGSGWANCCLAGGKHDTPSRRRQVDSRRARRHAPVRGARDARAPDRHRRRSPWPGRGSQSIVGDASVARFGRAPGDARAGCSRQDLSVTRASLDLFAVGIYSSFSSQRRHRHEQENRVGSGTRSSARDCRDEARGIPAGQRGHGGDHWYGAAVPGTSDPGERRGRGRHERSGADADRDVGRDYEGRDAADAAAGCQPASEPAGPRVAAGVGPHGHSAGAAGPGARQATDGCGAAAGPGGSGTGGEVEQPGAHKEAPGRSGAGEKSE